jgi:outer membrane protein assembly factor BamB
MSIDANVFDLTPPLRVAWRSASVFENAVAGNQSVYGVTKDGKVVALKTADGTQRWTTSGGKYVSNHLVRQGSRLFAYRASEGFGYLDDLGTTVTERLAVSFNATSATNLSTPIVDDRMVYLAVNQGLYALHQENGLQFGTTLSDVAPFSVGLIASRDVVVINRNGIPTRYHVSSQSFELTWIGEESGLNAGGQAPFVIADGRLVLAVARDLIAYDLATGRIAWHLPNTPAQALAAQDGFIYTAFYGANLRAIRIADGHVAWQRQYLYGVDGLLTCGISVVGDYLYFGTLSKTNPDGELLLAVRRDNGAFSWLSRAASGIWTGGIPISDGAQLYTVSPRATGLYLPLSEKPTVTSDTVLVSPHALFGPATDFGAGTINLTLPKPARISISTYREAQGIGTEVVKTVDWSAGSRVIPWAVSGSGGFTDTNQFGFMLVDVTEGARPTYTQAILLPVNTFPDILEHWARANIETMAFHRFVSGFEDQTFRPDGLVTRAESSTIIAKTLGLLGPNPGFKTKFTDIDAHWAKNFIMALEERGVIGGFAEPDGTFTFRPNLSMTRAQEARILKTAYNVQPAPNNFVSKFVDIAGHWAEPDIKALEVAGYVTGFQEANGTFTYRPEQNLTRAELSTVVVRIRRLSR